MCLILTCIVAIIVTGLCFLYPTLPAMFQLDRLALMYWSATLMWIIDGIFRIRKGDVFLELSVNDTLLGILIIFCGLIFWSLLTFIRSKKIFKM